MKTFKQIEEEIEEIFVMPPYFKPTEKEPIYDLEERRRAIKHLFKEISNQIIDECIGEKIPIESAESIDDREWRRRENEINGYNDKVQKLKEYKEEFNK